jgi:hypothetical protein
LPLPPRLLRVEVPWGRTKRIPLPDGGELCTLLDVGNYIVKLPECEYNSLTWRAATVALLLVAARGGDTMLPGGW